MKRVFFGLGLLGVVAVLGGCPIYPSQQQSEYQVCTSNGCYSCPDSSYSSACTPWACQSDSDCNQGYVCDVNPNDTNYGTCVAGSPPYGDASTPDCSVTGCPAGQVCKLANGVAQCVAQPGGGDDGGGSDAAGDTGSSGDGGMSTEASTDGSGDGATGAGPCNADSQCTVAGSKCIDGQCTTQIHLCSDGSQCNVAGSACVDGVCEAHCSGSSPCPNGYSCDLTRGVCNLNPGACTGTGTSDCQGGATCVETHCVPPCSTSDAGPACPSGQVCVNGGCIPDQGATFACQNDGENGQLATTCATNSICLHHDCYAACDADASPSFAPCSTGQTCKSVTIETGTYSVCGTSSTLGSDCDPAQGKYCSGGKVCVDGYCE